VEGKGLRNVFLGFGGVGGGEENDERQTLIYGTGLLGFNTTRETFLTNPMTAGSQAFFSAGR
jgi:hypothetical protein